MAISDKFDFSHGQLPPWLAPLVSLTRPIATTMTAAMLPVGAFMIGAVGFFDLERAVNSATAVGKFLHGIPDPLYWLIGAITTGYTAAKTAENMKAPAAPPAVKQVAPAPSPDDTDTDVAPRGTY